MKFWKAVIRWHRQQPSELLWWEAPLAVALFLLLLIAVVTALLNS